MKTNCFYVGEASRVMQEHLPNECIDLTITSPPYDNARNYDGTPFTWDVFCSLANELYRVTKQGGIVVWVVGDQTKDGTETLTSFKQALYFKEKCGFKMHDTMIYNKQGLVTLLIIVIIKYLNICLFLSREN